MNKLAFVALALVSAPLTAFAGGDCDTFGQCTAVPEISAVSGLAAVAALVAGVAIVRERMSR